MADNKKAILIYAEWIDLFIELSDDEAGRLIKHFFKYVNDLNPEAPDRITQLSFITIKHQLKRDLQKWEEKIKPQRVESGRLGGIKSGKARREKLKQNEANEAKALILKQNKANEAKALILKQNEHVDVDVDDILLSNNNNNIKEGDIFTLENCLMLFTVKTKDNWDIEFSKTQANIFYNFYASKNWMVGKNKMKSVSHAIGGWISRVDSPKATQVDGKAEMLKEFRMRGF
jgi:hypothetical protein